MKALNISQAGRGSVKTDHSGSILPLARYHFSFKTQTPVSLPEYAGSMLRGAFGRALRRLACMTRERDCQSCPLYAGCPYTLIFETPAPPAHALQRFSAVPNAYVIEPPPWGGRLYQPGEFLNFHMVLFGQALDKLPLIAYAWQKAFEAGVGGGTAALADIMCADNEESVYDPANNRLIAHEAPPMALPGLGGDFCLRFVTPLRLQENGKALPPQALTARVFLLALARRVSLLAEFHAGGAPAFDFQALNLTAAGLDCERDLKWRCWRRYSNRQKTTMTLNGLTGRLWLRGLPRIFGDLLWLGQWTHVGKNATFGLGRYLLEKEN
jgi:hypothetical protein